MQLLSPARAVAYTPESYARTRISSREPTVRTSYDVCGDVAGPRATLPSSSRNALPCHGHTTQVSPDAPGSNNVPDLYGSVEVRRDYMASVNRKCHGTEVRDRGNTCPRRVPMVDDPTDGPRGKVPNYKTIACSPK